MSESQSRFSIVDELIGKKSAAQEKILNAQKEVSDKEFEIKKWERSVVLTREAEKEIVGNLRSDKEREIKMLEQQVKEYDKGIIAVQSISKEQS